MNYIQVWVAHGAFLVASMAVLAMGLYQYHPVEGAPVIGVVAGWIAAKAASAIWKVKAPEPATSTVETPKGVYHGQE